MKIKVETPTIFWNGRTLGPEIVITKNRKTSHVRWSIYTMDNDYVLSEELGRLLNIEEGKIVKELGALFQSVRDDKTADRKAEQWSSGRWGSARFVPHAHAEKLAAFMAEKYIGAMEYCARNEAAIFKRWDIERRPIKK